MEDIDQDGAIACALNDEEFKERRALARQTIIPEIAAFERIESGLMCSFNQSAELNQDLESFVQLERQCCGFLSFEIIGGDHARPTTLRITGPKEASETIEMFIRNFNSGAV